MPTDNQAIVQDLLEKTSTTLAIAIRLLPEPLRQEASIAHLLFRAAHVLESAALWSPRARVVALRELDAMLAHSSSSSSSSSFSSSSFVALEVVAHLPMIIAEGHGLRPAAWGTIVRHARRAIAGIIAFSTTKAGIATDVTIHDDEDARRYAYVVAGVFGELITELFVEGGHVPRSAHRSLWRCANAFGEGLELACGGDCCRSELANVATSDLDTAELYVKALRQAGAGLGVVGYANLPLRRARSSSQQQHQQQHAAL
jgi:farnesyl-diphosphate farnesyltransferase